MGRFSRRKHSPHVGKKKNLGGSFGKRLSLSGVENLFLVQAAEYTIALRDPTTPGMGMEEVPYRFLQLARN